MRKTAESTSFSHTKRSRDRHQDLHNTSTSRNSKKNKSKGNPIAIPTGPGHEQDTRYTLRQNNIDGPLRRIAKMRGSAESREPRAYRNDAKHMMSVSSSSSSSSNIYTISKSNEIARRLSQRSSESAHQQQQRNRADFQDFNNTNKKLKSTHYTHTHPELNSNNSRKEAVIEIDSDNEDNLKRTSTKSPSPSPQITDRTTVHSTVGIKRKRKLRQIEQNLESGDSEGELPAPVTILNSKEEKELKKNDSDDDFEPPVTTQLGLGLHKPKPSEQLVKPVRRWTTKPSNNDSSSSRNIVKSPWTSSTSTEKEKDPFAVQTVNDILRKEPTKSILSSANDRYVKESRQRIHNIASSQEEEEVELNTCKSDKKGFVEKTYSVLGNSFRSVLSSLTTNKKHNSNEDEDDVSIIEKKEKSPTPPFTKEEKEEEEEEEFFTVGEDNHLIRYPFEGVKAVTVYKRDLERLQPDEFLNDSLIDFFPKIWSDDVNASTNPVHAFSSFFYTKLSSNVTAPDGGYSVVKRWTNNINLFEKQFLIVPVAENNHWYLVVVANAQHCLGLKQEDEVEKVKVVEEDKEATTVEQPENKPVSIVDSLLKRRVTTTSPTAVTRTRSTRGRNILMGSPLETNKPYIIIMDPLGHSYNETCKRISEYLKMEAVHKHGLDESNFVEPKFVRAKCPQQKNYVDCGIYCLHYIMNMYKYPDIMMGVLYENSREVSEKWDKDGDLHEFRKQLKSIIKEKIKQYHTYLEQPDE